MTTELIVNADDFGRSHGINRGIARAHDEGIVTSTSAMVRWPAALEAAEIARGRPELGVGLHVDLSEWAYREDGWKAVYEITTGDAESARAEVDAQLARFRTLFAHDPTHLDSHQHVHRVEPVRSIVVEMGRALGVPVRDCTPEIAYRGEFYGQTAEGVPLPESITVEAMLRLIDSLGPGISEVGCHPAVEAETGSSYADERPLELEVLCDPRVRGALDARGVVLRSFAGLAGRGI